MGSEAGRALLGGAATLVAALAVLTWQTVRIPGHAPHRVVAELRLAQAAAVLLAFSAAFAGRPRRLRAGPRRGPRHGVRGAGCGLALMTLVRDPRAALAWLGCGLPWRAPSWTWRTCSGGCRRWRRGRAAGSLVANLCAAACCVLPLGRTPTPR